MANSIKITINSEDFELTVSKMRIHAEAMRKEMEWKILYGTPIVIVTAGNCKNFDIPLLEARRIAAEAQGKLLLIDCRKTLALADRNDPIIAQMSRPLKSISSGVSIGYNDLQEEIAYEDTELRNRRERRHGRRTDKKCWQKDWRKP